MPDPTAVPILETPRLKLRGLVKSDAAAMQEFYGDAETMRYWDSPPSRDVAAAADHIRRSREMSPKWHAVYAVTLRDADRIIGMVSYHDRRPWQRRLSVGRILAKPWRRQGIMREAVSALLTQCFDISLGLSAASTGPVERDARAVTPAVVRASDTCRPSTSQPYSDIR